MCALAWLTSMQGVALFIAHSQDAQQVHFISMCAIAAELNTVCYEAMLHQLQGSCCSDRRQENSPALQNIRLPALPQVGWKSAEDGNLQRMSTGKSNGTSCGGYQLQLPNSEN